MSDERGGTMRPGIDDGPSRAPRLGYDFGVKLAFGWGLGLALLYGWLVLVQSANVGTLGFDFRAYDLAVDRLLAGQSMYDPAAQATGGFGLFFYPPPFAILIMPVALLPTELAVWTWTWLLIAASAAGIVLFPVSRRTRWIVGLLAALSWPLLYAIKLGQVGPTLLLLYAIGWRWMDRPWPLGLATGIGTIIKLQPALLIGWAAITGRRRAALIAVGVVAVLAVVGTLVAGPQAWLDEASLLGRVSRPIDTPEAYGLGRLAFEAGLGADVALLVHWANLALVLGVTAIAVWRGSAVASFLAVAVASQFVSPVLWDHYALILLLAVAWLIERGRWWAAAIPLVTSTPLIGWNPPISYPAAFWVTLLAVTWEGLREGRGPAVNANEASGATPSPAPA
jgi:glycosyl transferase family 87